MIRKTGVSPDELAIGKVPRLPTTVIMANGSIDKTKEDTVYVEDMDMFVTVWLFEDTRGAISGTLLLRKQVFLRVARRNDTESN